MYFAAILLTRVPRPYIPPPTGNTDEVPEHLPPCKAFSSEAGNVCPALGSLRCWKRQWRQLPPAAAIAAQSWTLKAFIPAGKAKTKQKYTLGVPVSPLGNSAASPTEQQEKSHSFPQRFYHLSLGMGEASPPSCEQASAFCWLFLCNQNKFLRDESRVFKGVQRDVKQASSVNQ